MLRLKKKEKVTTHQNPPASPTFEEMIEDVESADADDYVFQFMETLDEGKHILTFPLVNRINAQTI